MSNSLVTETQIYYSSNVLYDDTKWYSNWIIHREYLWTCQQVFLRLHCPLVRDDYVRVRNHFVRGMRYRELTIVNEKKRGGDRKKRRDRELTERSKSEGGNPELLNPVDFFFRGSAPCSAIFFIAIIFSALLLFFKIPREIACHPPLSHAADDGDGWAGRGKKREWEEREAKAWTVAPARALPVDISR